MITIREQKPNKIPGITSLGINFDYNADIIQVIKSTSLYSYDPKTKQWEIPNTSLSEIVKKLNFIDDITLILNEISDETEEKPQSIMLHKERYKIQPYKHQEEAIQYGLQEEHKKWLLLDAPGLGKTLTITYLAQELKETNKVRHCLIICGINTLKLNWKSEIEKTSELNCKILGERTTKKGNYYIGGIKERIEDLKHPIDEFFVITNVESLRNSELVKLITKGVNKFDMIIVDEVHRCATPTAQQTRGLLKLEAPYKIAATGTLLTNTPLNAYIPLKWIGIEHSNYTNFKYYYCIYEGDFNNKLVGYKNLKVLQEEINKNSLRRTKNLLDLPPKTIINEYIEMEEDQRKFYNNIKHGIIEEVDKIELKADILLSLITRLRQATSCPSILTTNTITSSKINRAVSMTEDIIDNGEKVVIFSVFKETLNVLYDKLKRFNPLLCTGDISDSIISENINLFQTNAYYKVMLATVQKMSTGVTLTAATNEIIIDGSWTAAQDEQMQDRIHRIGSKQPVMIYYLWNTNSIDLRVKEVVETKGLISDYVVDNDLPKNPLLMDKFKEIITELEEC